MARGFRLCGAERLGEVAHTQLTVVQQQPEDLEPRFIGEQFQESGSVLHGSCQQYSCTCAYTVGQIIQAVCKLRGCVRCRSPAVCRHGIGVKSGPGAGFCVTAEAGA